MKHYSDRQVDTQSMDIHNFVSEGDDFHNIRVRMRNDNKTYCLASMNGIMKSFVEQSKITDPEAVNKDGFYHGFATAMQFYNQAIYNMLEYNGFDYDLVDVITEVRNGKPFLDLTFLGDGDDPDGEEIPDTPDTPDNVEPLDKHQKQVDKIKELIKENAK